MWDRLMRDHLETAFFALALIVMFLLGIIVGAQH